MGTKNDPGQFDCHAAALPDEPQFTLLARDRHFAALVHLWAALRRVMIATGQAPASDEAKCLEAERLAVEGVRWRFANDGKWKTPTPT